jgi:hypothetical protein
VGNPVSWGEQRWEAFKNNDTSGQEQSRYLAASGSGRYTLWQVVWEDFASHPLLGIGTQNYEATYYQLREQDVSYVRQPHMLPLEMLSERGIIGGVLFFGFLATCLGAGLRKRFGNLSSEGKTQVGAMIAAIAYWFVHSSAEWFWQLPAVTLPAVVYLALLVGPWQRVEVAPLLWPLRAVVAAVSLVAIVAVAPLYVADRYLMQSYRAPTLGDAITAVKHAQDFNPVSSDLSRREAALAVQALDWDQAQDAYRNAIRLNPDHYAPYTEIASMYELRGQPDVALSYYEKALTLNPLDHDLKQRVNKLSGQTSAQQSEKEPPATVAGAPNQAVDAQANQSEQPPLLIPDAANQFVGTQGNE